MQDASASPMSSEATTPASADSNGPDASESVVSTHVLVPIEQVHKLRELARRTRIHQSEYLREAVEDLLSKYSRQADSGGDQ
ncbi:ribbon-helix-helix domain-containing protein [Archangium lansingense]|uniref:Ribbon-helix-helix domain-containing protein n=1 Tax=Archangium lansingense TaxID=2995310 RepID=A0ABT4ACH5_9BACT|nr:ribbon-helix-helix domain-containing protein [Archangium lansinium]MCY1079367.1 ribbon-helix-helix domain-containing protein [Archangium lansinium]